MNLERFFKSAYWLWVLAAYVSFWVWAAITVVGTFPTGCDTRYPPSIVLEVLMMVGPPALFGYLAGRRHHE